MKYQVIFEVILFLRDGREISTTVSFDDTYSGYREKDEPDFFSSEYVRTEEISFRSEIMKAVRNSEDECFAIGDYCINAKEIVYAKVEKYESACF